MWKVWIYIFIGSLIMMPGVSFAKRVALLVGNAAYQFENKLANPVNDTRLLSHILKNELHFDEVMTIENATIATLQQQVEQFKVLSVDADVAMIYFSGHGQQSDDRQNYLLGIDASIKQSNDLKQYAINSEQLLAATTGAKVRLVVLDACRDRPNSQFLTRSGAKGLLQNRSVEQNLLVAYATEEGKVAMDGQAGGNSPYATALAKGLRENNQPILVMLDSVAEQVAQQTHFKQNPTRSGNMRVNVYLTEPKQIGAKSKILDAEEIFWSQVKDSQQAIEYQAYIEQFPQGRYVKIAKERIALYTVIAKDKQKRISYQVDANSDEQLMQIGLWKDSKHHLIWMRCSLGQFWDGQSCVGQAKKYTWVELKQAISELNQQRIGGFNDWQIPYVEELATLRYCSTGYRDVQMIPAINAGEKNVPAWCTGSQFVRPTLNQDIFPNAVASMYWSANVSEDNFNNVWLVDFAHGVANNFYKYNSYYLRPVRRER